MARERLYRNNAEKQAAYRVRHRGQERASQALLASLAEELHGRLRQALEAGTSRAPAVVLGQRADQTLTNLIGYLTWGWGETRETAAPLHTAPRAESARKEEAE
jgi:hypothetical protein